VTVPQPVPGIRIEASPPPSALRDLSGIVTSLQQLLKIEHEARHAATTDELWFLLANESRRILQARQIFVLECTVSRCRVLAVSSLAKVDRESPTIRWLERVGLELQRLAPEKACVQARLPDLKAGADADARQFPFPHVMISPLRARQGQVFACLLAVREQSFQEAETTAAERLSQCFAHAAEALGAVRNQKAFVTGKRIAGLVGVAALAALAMLPVPMTVLAPAEVVAQEPFMVTAPIDGAIGEIMADPGQVIRKGDTVARLVDTQQRNQLAIAEQEVSVAEAKWRQVSLAAFGDANARRELTIVTTERDLKRAERDYAQELLARTVIRSDRDGVALFADKRELIGRPVQTGQKLMEVADPAKLRLRAQASIDDAMALRSGATIRFFPDADPLNPLELKVTDASHQARATESGTLAFRVDADIPEQAAERLRIGHRGTAQIHGEPVALGFYLFRRPLSALRQRFGL
jgi:multidrug efflux pump subunit AcrA (membrane-fusion protein)